MEPNLTNKHSANASANGYEFQYAAALMIYLVHIKAAKCFGVEKENDIFLELVNGEKIYAQAKSSLKANSIAKNHFEDIVKSLGTLSENNDKANKLISIFNYFRPFGRNDSFLHDGIYDIKKFNNLTKENKTKLKSSIAQEYKIDFEKLEFWFLRFEGEDKCIGLKTYIREKLSNITDINIDSLIDCWMRLITQNAPSETKLIESEIIAGTLFAKILERTSFDTIVSYINMADELSIDDTEVLNTKFEKFIVVSAYHFMAYNKIIASYYDFCNQHKELKRKTAGLEFIQQYGTNEEVLKIADSLFNEFDTERRKYLTNIMAKILIGYACAKADVINRIKEVFGYDN